MTEQFANNAVTTLNGTITSGATSLVVTSAAAFPSGGNFRIIIDSEIMLVTGVSSNTFTVTRAQEGTSAAAHSSGAIVQAVITKGGLAQWASEKAVTGPIASLPAAGIAGRQYFTTDSPYRMVDNGSTWDYFVGAFNVIPPAIGNFTWVNQSSALSDTTHGGIIMKDTSHSSAHSNSMLVKSAPTAPYTVVFGFYYYFQISSISACGPVWRDSASGKVESIRLSNENGNLNLLWEQFSDPTTHFGVVFAIATGNQFMSGLMFVKLEDDNTNRNIYIGPTPYYFPYLISSTARTTFMTPNQIGLGINAYSQNTGVHYVHYKEN